MIQVSTEPTETPATSAGSSTIDVDSNALADLLAKAAAASTKGAGRPASATTASRTARKVPPPMSPAAAAESFKREVLDAPEPDETPRKMAGGRSGKSLAGAAEYKRPNGMTYYGRPVLDGKDDVQMLRAMHDAGISVFLYGEPGTGKTAMFEAAFNDGIVFQGTGETEEADLVGSYVPTGPDSFEWKNGPLLQAVIDDVPFLLDEAALINPKSLSVVYGLMDGRGVLDVKANPSIGHAHVKPGGRFRIHAACNPNVPGADLSDALLSRFAAHFEVMTDWDTVARLGITGTILRLAKQLHARRASGDVSWAPQIRELLAFVQIAKVAGEAAALANLIGRAPEYDRAAYGELIGRITGATIFHAAIGRPTD